MNTQIIKLSISVKNWYYLNEIYYYTIMSKYDLKLITLSKEILRKNKK